MPYPGGKAASGTYQQIINLIPPHRVYIEPFLGGGAIARAKRPAAVNILIDLDPSAIAAFGVVDQTAINGDASGVAAIPDPIANGGDAHRYPSPETTIGAPIASIGDAAPPPNPAMLANLATFDDTASNGDASAYRRAAVRLFVADALAFLQSYPFQGDEFVYCDPPYLLQSRSSPRRIYRCELSDADHVALLGILKGLPCKVMLSGYWSQLYADALASWYTHTFESITRSGKTATEWLWMNYPRPVALHQYDYLGSGFRERERIKRKKSRWVQRLQKMPILEKQAILAAIQETL